MDMRASTSPRSNRRRFLKAKATSGLGAIVVGNLSGQQTKSSNAEGLIAQPPAAAAAGTSTLPPATGLAPKFWVEPSIAKWPPGPMRKVHIEYHTSRHMPKLAEKFNAEAFAGRLVEARVTGATVFAKDMYGYSYYPSQRGPMHPNLSFDRLGAQVAALRKQKISVLAYYMTTWNPELAERLLTYGY